MQEEEKPEVEIKEQSENREQPSELMDVSSKREQMLPLNPSKAIDVNGGDVNRPEGEFTPEPEGIPKELEEHTFDFRILVPGFFVAGHFVTFSAKKQYISFKGVAGVGNKFQGMVKFQAQSKTPEGFDQLLDVQIVFRHITNFSVHDSVTNNFSLLVFHVTDATIKKMFPPTVLNMDADIDHRMNTLSLDKDAKKTFVCVLNNRLRAGQLVYLNGQKQHGKMMSSTEIHEIIQKKVHAKCIYDKEHPPPKRGHRHVEASFFGHLPKAELEPFLRRHGLRLVGQKIEPCPAPARRIVQPVLNSAHRQQNRYLELNDGNIGMMSTRYDTREENVRGGPQSTRVSGPSILRKPGVAPLPVVRTQGTVSAGDLGVGSLLKPGVPNQNQLKRLAPKQGDDIGLGGSAKRSHLGDSSVPTTSTGAIPSMLGRVTKNNKKKLAVDCMTIEDDDEEKKEIIKESNEKKSDLLTYPKEGRDRVTIHYEDMKGTGFNEMLNDTIVDFFLRYIHHTEVPEDVRDKIHVMSCFFYKKLTEGTEVKHFKKSIRSGELRFMKISNNYKTMRSWTKKVNLFEKDYIIVPIVDEMHWYMAVIVRPYLAVSTDSTGTEENKLTRKVGSSRENPDTYIIVMDSLRENEPKRRAVVDLLRDYLELEFEDKKPLEGRLERTRVGEVVPVNLPQQSNYVDCGLYVLKYAETFFKKLPKHEELSTFDWDTLYPNFCFNLLLYREILRKRIQACCNKQVWEKFVEWQSEYRENQHIITGESKDDIALLREEADIDCARRRRCYSEVYRPQLHLLLPAPSRYGNSLQLRKYRSLPAKLDFVEKLHFDHF